MDKKYFTYFGAVFLILAFFTYFVMAAPASPTALIFNNNVTSDYDEGNFFVNWTSGGGDEVNYSIYIFSNNTLYLKADNDSNTGYSFSNTTEANYTFIIEAVNATNDLANSSSNISIYVDSSAPTISLPFYTNGTSKKNTAQLTLNISVADGLSGTTGTLCLIDVNGTNQTVSLDSGWCNSTAINLTELPDGNQTINVYVNDTVNNFGLNNSFVVQVDTTNPTASAECSPSTVYVGETVTCTCSGTDATSGVSSSTSSSTPSTDGSGTFSYTCVVTDNAGNSKTTSDSYVVRNYPSGSSSQEWTESKTHAWTRVLAGETATFENFGETFGVNRIQIRVKEEVQNLNILVKGYNSKPTEISAEKSGKIYKYLQIETENLENDNIGEASIRIQVESSWMNENNLGNEDISLFKFNEESENWVELETTFLESDDDFYYYDVMLDSFSYFVIGEKSLPEEGKEENGINGNGLAEKGKNLVWLWILIGAIVIAFLGGVWYKKNKMKR